MAQPGVACTRFVSRTIHMDLTKNTNQISAPTFQIRTAKRCLRNHILSGGDCATHEGVWKGQAKLSCVRAR